MEKITFQTKDSKKIVSLFYPAKNSYAWIVYSHMMPATKESYEKLAASLQKKGFNGLAVDLRGHGESEAGPDGYREFTDKEHQLSIYDLQAAVDFLQKKGSQPKNMFFIGASIGANLSLQYIVQNPDYSKAVLLSAGLNYRNIKTDGFIKKLQPNQRVFLVSGKDDGTNAKENQDLFNLAPLKESVRLKIYETGGHGTDLIDSHPELIEEIANFLVD